ncbi:integration host factor subunit beta (plasmid) [Paracoccus sp. Arc7-R13]|uniref:HU family DNA-binding protein n=1 Tax=Paracoccus sp. Arc7-R13 TaxID=2500532 RepID=UPI000FDA7E9C|nr:HU family DNA-binding protein [Paracoccus sp. Arc7-R13]AZY96058.1 integration host factor subunit beta [Paracoccus sp. Arc7-R13]
MVRSELLEKLVQAHPHLPRHVVELALEAILNEITARLAQGHRVELRRFGNFTCRVREARMGRNPRTGEPVFMETRQILHFRAGRHILDRLNRSTLPG